MSACKHCMPGDCDRLRADVARLTRELETARAEAEERGWRLALGQVYGEVRASCGCARVVRRKLERGPR